MKKALRCRALKRNQKLPKLPSASRQEVPRQRDRCYSVVGGGPKTVAGRNEQRIRLGVLPVVAAGYPAKNGVYRHVTETSRCLGAAVQVDGAATGANGGGSQIDTFLVFFWADDLSHRGGMSIEEMLAYFYGFHGFLPIDSNEGGR